MPIMAILYDLDGVLVDACEWHYVALNLAIMEIANDQINRDEHESTFNGLPTKAKLRLMARQGRLVESQIDSIYNRKQTLTIDAIKSNSKKDDAKVAVHEYSKSFGIISACVTNCSEATAKLMLEATGQLAYMSGLWANEHCRNYKPHPEPYIRAMIRFGFAPEEYLIVEDSNHGLEAARMTGAKVWKVAGPADVTIEGLQVALK